MLNTSAKACKPVPSVPNGRIKCPNDEFVYGSSCLTTCDDGYKLTGTYFVSCDENGDWGTLGICKGNSLCGIYNEDLT